MKTSKLVEINIDSKSAVYEYHSRGNCITEIEVFDRGEKLLGPAIRISLLNQIFNIDYTVPISHFGGDKQKITEEVLYACDKFYIWLRLHTLYELLISKNAKVGTLNYVKELKDGIANMNSGKLMTWFLSRVNSIEEADIFKLNEIYKKYR